jgi:Fe-S oxidoreductase
MILDPLLKRKALLHMGCGGCSGGDPERILAESVLEKLGIPFETKDLSCGCNFYDWGDEARLEKMAEEAKQVYKWNRFVIVGCGRCLFVLRKYHGIEAKHISQVVLEALQGMELRKRRRGRVVYHDPCFLARYERVMEAPRKVLKLLGYEVMEFKNNREKTDCCGDYSVFPALRQRIASTRLGQAKGGDPITAACPKCIMNFRDLNKENDKKTRIKSFLELVDACLK